MEYSFDTWTSLFLLASAQGVFLSLLLFSSKKYPKIILGIITLLFSVTLIEYVFFWTGYRYLFPHINRISEPYFYLYGPLIFFYSTTNQEQTTRKVKDHVVHLVPFAISLLLLLPYYFLDSGMKTDLMVNGYQDSFINRVYVNFNPWFQVTHMLFYLIIGYKKSTSIEYAQRVLVQTVLALYSGFVIGFASYFIMILLAGYLKGYDYAISITMSVFIYGIGYLGYQKKLVVEKITLRKYKNSGLNLNQARLVSDRLIDIMETEKIYLDRDLNLDRLASATKTSKHKISQTLNEEIGKKFSDFVNEYRIKEAKKLILNRTDQLSIQGIAFESGFNNKTSFNTAFKKFTGLTPTQFLKQNGTKAVKSD